MKLKAGDKVKYLNATGGGIVTKVIDSRMVMVADEHGFDMPTMISELVKIDLSEPSARLFEESYGSPDAIIPSGQRGEAQKSAEEETDSTAGDEALDPGVIRYRNGEEIFLLFVPHDQKWLITGLMDVFLVNNTSYDLIYNLVRRVSLARFEGVDYGSVFANTRHVLTTADRDELSRWTEGSIQFLFHQERMSRLIPPFNLDFRIDPKKFHTEGAYRAYPFHADKGILAKILSLTDYLMESADPVKDLPETSPGPLSTHQDERPMIFRYQTEPKEAVVDLHIHELLEDSGGMKSGEILEYQKNHFRKCLDSAMEHHFQTLIFIHGVGNGVLREALKGMLRNTEGIEYFDAPMDRYGVGALQIRIAHNR